MNDNMLNEKREMFLDMQEHPEKYTDEQISQLLADADIREFARHLAMSKRALLRNQPEKADTNQAWEAFAHTHPTPRHNRMKVAATAAGIIFLSSVALAAVIRLGIFKSESQPAADAQPQHTEQTSTAGTPQVAPTLPANSTDTAPVVFEDAELSVILTQMGAYYHADIAFQQEKSRHIRLYFKWDKQKTLQQQVELLNAFDRINITLHASTLNVK